MAKRRILVIAPNPDLRKSLAFSLEADGYVVTSHAGILGRDAGRGYDCVVLDHRAAAGPREPVLSFCSNSPPVLLLAAAPQSWLSGAVFDVVATPLIGDALSQAVRAATAAARVH